MANISADLVRYNGLIGPQYLDPDDKTGGPDGTMKPITKDILREMIVTNFPELMNVTDLEVQNKLAQVETKLAALDQKLMTLDDIKQQLQGTLNTQLTGSKVEEIIANQLALIDRMDEKVITEPIGQSVESFISNQRTMINVLSNNALIFGVYWNKGSDPTMIRTDGAEGKVAEVGIDGQLVRNDFDSMPIWGEIGEVKDEYGNEFVKIPKFYIRKRSGDGFYLKQISKTQHPGFYLPAIFWDFENSRELEYALIGKYEASLSDDGLRLESKPGKHPLVEKNIVEFRDYARANGKGYQQNDIHAIDVLQALFHIEFATLHSQSVALGYTSGNYSSAHEITIAEQNTNRAIVSNDTASRYEVGQTFGVGTTLYNNNVTPESRLITAIEPYDELNSAIYFDGDPITTTVGNLVANRGAITGFSKNILASSGTVKANDGKNPFVYRGIENPWGSVYEWIDGINIIDHQAWVARNADNYASNVFAEPYEKLGYVNSLENGYPTEMGFDPELPFAEFPTAIGAGTSTYYSDYYYQTTGQRVARFGGRWAGGSSAGLSLWSLSDSSGSRNSSSGGRLLKKAL